MNTTAAISTWHSQPQTDQDRWVVDKSCGKFGGHFVEIGGYDGLRHSNTLALERSYGWTGLLVEPNPLLFPQMVENRPGCDHANVAIAPIEGLHKFILGDAFGGLATYFPRDWYEEHQRRRNEVVAVEAITLAHLFDAYFTPPIIDYLSLDVEGAEYVILEQFINMKADCGQPVGIRFLTVEFRHDMELLERLKKLLDPYFHFDKTQAWDAFFINKVLA